MNYPMTFEARSKGSSGIQSHWKSSVNAGEISAAVPAEFSGPGGAYSPEDLYAMAALNCFVGTFKVVAQNSKLSFESITGKATVTLDKNEKNLPAIKSIDFHIELTQASDVEKALRLLKKVSETAIVINSLAVEKKFSFSTLYVSQPS